jgi:hypothetical protein
MIAVYSLFSILSGPRGISASNQLLTERDRQWDNLKELGYINQELESVKDSLLHDEDTLRVRARQMGYGQEDERFIRIVGLGDAKNTPAQAGKVYFAQAPSYISDKIIKITALCAGLVVFAFFFVLELIDSKVH